MKWPPANPGRFTQQSSMKSAQTFYSDIKGRLPKYGRISESLIVLPGLSLYIGRTRAEAEEKYEEMQSLTPPQFAIRQLSLLLGVDLSNHPLDAQMPKVAPTATRANPERWLEYSRDGHMTLRQAALRATAAKAHWVTCSTMDRHQRQ